MNADKLPDLQRVSASFSDLRALAGAQEAPAHYVRPRRARDRSTQLDRFRAPIREGIEAAVRIEPGVLALFAVLEKENPAHVHVFEMYADAKAYETRLQTPHLKKFRDATDKMVTSESC